MCVLDSAHTFAAVLVAVFPAVALSKCALSLPPLSQVFSAPVCVEENRLCFSVGDLI